MSTRVFPDPKQDEIDRLRAEVERLKAERDARLSQFEQFIRHHFSTYGQTTLAKAIQELRSWGDATRKAGEEPR